MISDNLSIGQICTSFEGVLRLEYSETTTTEECIKNAIKSLENAYNIAIDKDVYQLQSENSLVRNDIDRLLHSVTECMKTASLYTSLGMFRHNISISLAETNYLGFAREYLLTQLKYFQDIDFYTKREQAVISISDALNTVPISHTKRLFVILLMLEKLGISEGVAVIAHLLYIGGIV